MLRKTFFCNRALIEYVIAKINTLVGHLISFLFLRKTLIKEQIYANIIYPFRILKKHTKRTVHNHTYAHKISQEHLSFSNFAIIHIKLLSHLSLSLAYL